MYTLPRCHAKVVIVQVEFESGEDNEHRESYLIQEVNTRTIQRLISTLPKISTITVE